MKKYNSYQVVKKGIVKFLIFIILSVSSFSSYSEIINTNCIYKSKVTSNPVKPLGGWTIIFTNFSISAIPQNSGNPQVIINWNNSHYITGNTAPFFIAFEQWLTRVDSNGNTDTIFNSTNFSDTLFIDTTVLSGNFYHYQLTRGEHQTAKFFIVSTDTVSFQTVGVSEAPFGSAQGASSILVYPNPSNGIFTIESEVKIERVEMFGITGTSVQFERSSSFSMGTSIHSETSSESSVSNEKYRDAFSKLLDLTDYPNGIYFLKVELENGALVTKKIIKQ
jgi:hypothetical protein